jgi:glucokinase
MLYLGIDIGATNLKYGILDENNDLIYDNTFKISQFSTRHNLLEYLIEEIQSLESHYGKFKTIGIGCPGMITKDGTIIESPNIPDFKNFDFKNEFETKSHRKISFDNDANCGAIAELLIGSGKELDNFIYITLGTGVGGAIIINRKIFYGDHGSAGEIGHILINPFEKMNSEHPYRTGVLESYIGKDGIIQIAKNLASNHPESPIVKYNQFDVPHISRLADQGDRLSIITMKIVGHYLGYAIATVSNLLDITTFIIG